MFEPQKSERPINRRGVRVSPIGVVLVQHQVDQPKRGPGGQHLSPPPASSPGYIASSATVDHTVDQLVPVDGGLHHRVALVLLKRPAEEVPGTRAEPPSTGTRKSNGCCLSQPLVDAVQHPAARAKFIFAQFVQWPCGKVECLVEVLRIGVEIQEPGQVSVILFRIL